MLNRENPFKVYVTDFEAEAEAFLRHYRCEEAINEPRPIPIKDIATKMMSLEIIDSECLSLDGSVQGAIAFTKGVVDVYDWTTNEYIGFPTGGPSLFIDSSISNEGRINNTVAHECYHWWRHRNYFNYKRLHESGVEFGIRCDMKVLKSEPDPGKWTEVERMEWQARTIAPKILMPRIATKKKIEQLFEEAFTGEGYSERREAVIVVIDRLAKFYHVSNQAAAIRMTELGYPEAERYCSYDAYHDGPGSERKRSRAHKHQQPITPKAAFELYLTNRFFRTMIDTGAFCFSGGYFVLKDEKYVSLKNGLPALTEYAKSHLYECTIDVSRKLYGEAYLIHGASAHLMYRSDTVFKEKDACDNSPQNADLYNKAEQFKKRYEHTKKTHKTASEILLEYMDHEHWNSTLFKEHTNLDDMTYSRVKNNYEKFTMKPLVTMGYALGLDLSEMEEVLKAAGLAFNPTKMEDQAYKYLFTAFPERDIDECNEFLENIGVQKLGSKQKK